MSSGSRLLEIGTIMVQHRLRVNLRPSELPTKRVSCHLVLVQFAVEATYTHASKLMAAEVRKRHTHMTRALFISRLACRPPL
jgi:hypothetical protein